MTAQRISAVPLGLTGLLAGLDRRAPDPLGPVVVEGVEAVRWLLGSALEIRAILAKRSTWQGLADDGAARELRPPVYLGERRELADLLGFDFQRGVVAVAERPVLPTVAGLLAQGARRLLVADAVHDPGNIGGLIRTARCLGLDGLVLGPGCTDPFYRRCVRVSVGHVFHLPVAVSDDLTIALEQCRRAGLRLAAAHRSPRAVPIRRSGAAASWALVVGNEDRGIAPAVAELVDEHLLIPMAAGVDSLNVVVAAGIIAAQWAAPPAGGAASAQAPGRAADGSGR